MERQTDGLMGKHLRDEIESQIEIESEKDDRDL